MSQKNSLLGTDDVIVWEDMTNPLLNAEEEQHATEFAQLFEAEDQKRAHIKEGKIISGTITNISSDVVIVDIGHKTDGEIPTYEFKSIDGVIKVETGQDIEVFLESFENRYGQLVLSYEKAELMKAWDKLGLAFENEEVISGKIVRRVKGGLHVDIGVRAFLPGSQIDLRPVKNLDDFVGETYDYKIIKFNKARSNVVISRRVLLESSREQTRHETLKNLEEGKVIPGVVKNLTDYGAFVDLGGVDGLLHITDMSWGRVNHPSQIFDVGQEIEVMILTYDPKSMRVSLGYKQLQPDPWLSAIDKYHENTITKGLVVSLTDYGAFVELEDGIEGLIHISEMSWSKRIKHPSKVVSIGDEVECMILGIDPKTKRISLGLKQLEENPWHGIEQKYQVGDVIKGQVRNITDFGIFVAVEEGVDALVHISDISWVSRIKRPAELYHKGQEIEAMVLQIDTKEEKFSLSIKQLTPDPWLEVMKLYTPGSKHKGVISKIMNFGIFVRIEEGFDGLIHISELDLDDGAWIYDHFKTDDEIQFAVLSVDKDNRKISLSCVACKLDGAELESYIEQANSSREPAPKHRGLASLKSEESLSSSNTQQTQSTDPLKTSSEQTQGSADRSDDSAQDSPQENESAHDNVESADSKSSSAEDSQNESSPTHDHENQDEPKELSVTEADDSSAERDTEGGDREESEEGHKNHTNSESKVGETNLILDNTEVSEKEPSLTDDSQDQDSQHTSS